MSPLDFAARVIAYCAGTNASVTSWGRTAKRNKQVGGVPESAHIIWLAADVVYDEPLEKTHRTALANRLGIKLIDEGDHDHIQGG